MASNMMQILSKTPLRCYGDGAIDDIVKLCGRNRQKLLVLVAIEYGRILGKREERARRAKRQTIMEE